MKNIIKPVAVTLLASMLLMSAGCSGDTKWSFKAGKDSLSSGTWIYSTYRNITKGLQELQKEDGTLTMDKADFEKLEIEGKKAKDWIYDQAKKECLRELTLRKLAKENDVKMDEDTLNNFKKSRIAEEKALYLQFGLQAPEDPYKSSKDIFERLGVSEASFDELNYYPDYLADAVFKAVYGKGGKMEVTDDELQKYFKDNYTTYYYLSYSLKTDSGEALDDETKEKNEENFRKYKVALNDQGKTIDDISKQYRTDYDLQETDAIPGGTETGVLDDLEDENLKKVVQDAKEKVADVVTQNDTVYLIYKGDINEKAKDIKPSADIKQDEKDMITRESVLVKMKTKDFDKYIEDEQASLKYERNGDCISKYSVMRSVDIIKQYMKENQNNNA